MGIKFYFLINFFTTAAPAEVIHTEYRQLDSELTDIDVFK